MDNHCPTERPRVVAPAAVTPVRMLQALRDQPGLAALLGDWHHGDALIAFRPTRVLAPDEDPFAALGAAGRDGIRTGAGEAFGGGWIGYLGYQLAGSLEVLPPPPPHAGGLPDHHLAHYDHALRRRASTGEWVLEALPGADPARVDESAAIVAAALAAPAGAQPYRCGPFSADASGAQHAAAVTAALGHIRDGDIFQANVCRGLEAGFEGDPLDLFCAGHETLRPRFAAFLRLPGGAVASLSPELYLRRTGDEVLSSPIKGTAPGSSDPAALHASAKNRAENVMIVDLMRNDLSRTCVPGSVRAPATPRVEAHTGVHHLVADVHGRLRPGLDDADLLRASFPPGSCTGAPKIRAMEIIHALEPAAREVYTGAIGYAGPSGLALNVAIRTFEFAGDRVRLGVGGGIVADSDPVDEAHETLVKARPLLRAVGARFDAPLAAEWAERSQPSARGLPVVPVPPPDPGRGVFTTLLVRSGVPVDLARHLARLEASTLACYGAPLPAGLPEEVRARADALSGPHRLRITAVPGGGTVRTELTTAALTPSPAQAWRLVPLVLPGGLGGHKWVDRRALEWAPAPGLWSPSCDPLLVEADGELLETGRANVFVVTGDGVLTPPADGRILPGVLRARTIDALRAGGRTVHEHPVGLDGLAGATELFVTNSLRGAVPVAHVDGVGRWEPGPVARWVGRRLGAAPEPAAPARGR